MMRLGLSADAAPDATIAELAAACARRGLVALELVGMPEPAESIGSQIHDAGGRAVHLCGVVVDAAGDPRRDADLSRIVRAPVIVRNAGNLHAGVRRAHAIRALGGSALLLVHGPAAEWLPAVADQSTAIAWTVDESCPDPDGDAQRILDRIGRIDYIRLAGSGPESVMHEGRGIGPLMRRLALARFDGPLVLTPGSRRYRVAWSIWLGRRGGWGCGSAGREHLPDRTLTTVQA